MDITAFFRANVRTVSLRNKHLGDVKVPKKEVSKSKSAFLQKAQTIIKQINSLHELLLDKRTAYLNVSQHLTSIGKCRMTDAERDELDSGGQQIISTCSQLIRDMKREVAQSYEQVSPQNIEHHELSLALMDNYLKNVCKIYSEQRAIRIKRAVEKRRLSRLKVEVSQEKSQELNKSQQIHLSKNQEINKLEEVNLFKIQDKIQDNVNSFKIQELNGDVSASGNSQYYEDELSPEDVQLLESENEHLFHELSTVTEEVRQLESKVVHIAELQEMFTEKVLDQDKNLDRIMTTVVGSTENVKEANEQIRQAIQRNAGLRAWMLFFLLVMSFSLLFLDWYNP